MTSIPTELEGFSGPVPLFPLPNLVVFPRVVQPLHIFEPRYRKMIEDVLEGNRLIGMALISPGNSDTGTPSLFPHICLGKISAEERLEDGRFNILLQGLCRGRILEELPQDQPYRVARVQLLADLVREDQMETELRLREEILGRLEKIILKRGDPQMMEMIRQEQVPLGVLSDVLAYTSGLQPLEMQDLLAESGILDRSLHLLRLLGTFPVEEDLGKADEPGKSRPDFPPPFSLN